jgi:co-chaperonin GroES (HSP10)
MKSVTLILLAGIFASAALAQNDRVLGVVTKIDATARALTVKPDAGAEVIVTMQATVSFRRVAPGETDLSKAATIAFTDISVGDRVLARGKSGENQSVAATLVVVMSQGDIAKKQETDRADWDRRGITGLVTEVGGKTVTISTRTPTGPKPVVITPAANAAVRRYALDSVKFSDAKPSALAEIKVGDQVRARGDRNEDGTNMTALEIVSGRFKTIAGVVLAVDRQTNEIRVNDLDSKKPVVVRISPDSSVRKLPAQSAQTIATRLRGASGAGDIQQMIDQSPSITVADLKNGDAVVVSSTVGVTADKVTAILLLAGVEPILTKPGTREMSLSSWNLDIGGGP